jgi:hypothetical protein
MELRAVKRLVRSYVRRHFELKADAADHWAMSRQQLSAIMSLESDRPPTKIILDELGYEKIRRPSYRRKK